MTGAGNRSTASTHASSAAVIAAARGIQSDSKPEPKVEPVIESKPVIGKREYASDVDVEDQRSAKRVLLSSRALQLVVESSAKQEVDDAGGDDVEMDSTAVVRHTYTVQENAFLQQV